MNNKGSGILILSWKYLQHLVRARHRNGHGIHSPYVYDFIRNILFNHQGIELPAEPVQYHQFLKRNNEILNIDDKGAGSRVTSNNSRNVASIARHSSVRMKQGALLFRIVKWYKPLTILEFGSGLGISTAYMAAAAQNASLISIEGSPEKHDFLEKHRKEAGLERAELLQGHFDDFFPAVLNRTDSRLLVFIDGDHRYNATIDKVRAILDREDKGEVILILDDIYWSKEMERAWKDCCLDPVVRISIDLFNFGIIIKRPDIAKQHFRVSF